MTEIEKGICFSFKFVLFSPFAIFIALFISIENDEASLNSTILQYKTMEFLNFW